MSYPELKMLIAGEWVFGSTGKSEPVICPADGSEIGRGLSAYASTEAQRMIGLTSEAMQAELGYRGRAEMVHRDDMVLTVAPNGDKTEDKD